MPDHGQLHRKAIPQSPATGLPGYYVSPLIVWQASRSEYRPEPSDNFVAESDGSSVTEATDGMTLIDYNFAANGSLLVYLDGQTTNKGLGLRAPRWIVP
jgi:hypothetical protein